MSRDYQIVMRLASPPFCEELTMLPGIVFGGDAISLQPWAQLPEKIASPVTIGLHCIVYPLRLIE
jgi:hypothetical protein